MTSSIRAATQADAPIIANLLRQLGHPISPETVAHQLFLLAGTGCDRVLVAEADDKVLGVLSLHWTPLLHRDRPLGRITALVVDESARGQSLGSRLVAEAEGILREAGCSAVEVTSNVRRAEAHEFYRGLGYAQPSAYFRRSLDADSEKPPPRQQPGDLDTQPPARTSPRAEPLGYRGEDCPPARAQKESAGPT